MRTTKIAMADDNRELVSLMEEYINLQPNMEVVATAYNGRACMELIENVDIDVLILDVIMPYLDGIAVLDSIKEKAASNEIHVIMLSAFGQEAIMQRAAEYGASYFLMKPFELEYLIKQINHLTGSENEVKTGTIEEQVVELLRVVGIPLHIKGFTYLKQAITFVHEDESFLEKITKRLYPAVADRYSTTATRVERSIRHAIDLVWKNEEIETIAAAFSYSDDRLASKPSNSRFIAMAVDSIKHKK